jgi:hypothetical protein
LAFIQARKAFEGIMICARQSVVLGDVGINELGVGNGILYCFTYI